MQDKIDGLIGKYKNISMRYQKQNLKIKISMDDLRTAGVLHPQAIEPLQNAINHNNVLKEAYSNISDDLSKLKLEIESIESIS